MAWGNLKSLYKDKAEHDSNEDDDELWNDLRKFYDDHYSADRMKLVISCSTEDDC